MTCVNFVSLTVKLARKGVAPSKMELKCTINLHVFLPVLCLSLYSVSCAPGAEIKMKREDILDTRFPILIAESAQSSPFKSYFGFSVALARKTDTITSEDPVAWVFVGAPKANASARMYSDDDTPEAGILWRCSLGRDPAQDHHDGCEKMNVDPSPRSAGKSQQPRPNNAPQKESHDGAFVGGATIVQYNTLVTCGPRWHRGAASLTSYQGVCYWFQKDDAPNKDSTYISDLTNLVNKGTYEHRLIPLFNHPSEAVKDLWFQSFNHTGGSQSSCEFLAGEAGFAVHLFVDDTHNRQAKPNLLIGAPGVREWSGAVVLYRNSNAPDKKLARVNRNPSSPTFSEYVVMVGTAGIMPDKDTIVKGGVFWNEYFGYSVSSGRYFNKDKVLFSAGVPRAGTFNGEVHIFEEPPYTSTSTYKRKVEPQLKIGPPASAGKNGGIAFGSYFGAALHTLDVDGDEVDELVVGAPLYTFETGSFEKTRKRGVEKDRKESDSYFGDQGCVFIYKFSTKGTKTPPEPYQIITGEKKSTARFGTAISSFSLNLKNKTKETYLLVGAPFESSEDGSDSSGAVYLYKYNEERKKFDNCSQRILAAQISPVLKGFGSSISLPEDIDNNDTPDISIGSFESGHAVVLRTRPRIVIESLIKFANEEEEETTQIRQGIPHFFVKSCFKVKENLGVVVNKADVWARVKLTDRKVIKFPDNAVAGSNGITSRDGTEVIYKLKVDMHRHESCQTVKILPENKAGLGLSATHEFQSIEDLFFTQEVWYNETYNKAQSVYTIYASEPATPSNIAFDSFDKMKPTSQFSKSSAYVSVSQRDCRDNVCRPKIIISATFHNESGHQISDVVVGKQNTTLLIVIKNMNESAPRPTLTLDWKNTAVSASFKGGSAWLPKEPCKGKLTSKQRAYTCDFGLAYLRKDKNITLELLLNTENMFVKDPEANWLIVNLKMEFGDKHLEPVKSGNRLQLEVRNPDVIISGARLKDVALITPASYTTTNLENEVSTVELYAPFRQRNFVKVRGVSVQKVTAVFQIPMNNLKAPLFLIQAPLDNPSKLKCSATGLHFGFYIIMPANGVTGSSSTAKSEHSRQLLLDLEETHRQVFRRRRRNIDDVEGSGDHDWQSEEDTPDWNGTITPIEIATDWDPLPPKPPKQPKLDGEASDALLITCNGEINCMEITCEVMDVEVEKHSHIVFEIYPVKNAIDNLLKESGKSSILVNSLGTAEIFPGSPQSDQDTDVAQVVLIRISQSLAFWVYIVGGICGILLLALIVFGLYKCGFFKREKRQQLNNMMAEHKRKSMIATARMSIMPPPILEEAESQENLTEAEHYNVDNCDDRSTVVEEKLPTPPPAEDEEETSPEDTKESNPVGENDGTDDVKSHQGTFV